MKAVHVMLIVTMDVINAQMMSVFVLVGLIQKITIYVSIKQQLMSENVFWNFF